MEIDYQNKWYQDYKPGYKQFDENLPEYWLMKYSDRAKLIRDINPKAKTMLDIGCGLGRAMTYFKGLCFDVWGVEPSEYAWENNPHKEQVYNNYFDKLTITKTFDIIYIEQVLSHIPDWKGTLKKAVSLLNPNGVIVIEEPNDNSELQQILVDRGHKKYWRTKDHVNYFNLNDGSIRNYLTTLGCETKTVTATFPMEFFELMGVHYIGSDKIGKMVHKMRFDLLRDLGDKRIEFLESMAKLGWGRDLVLYAGMKTNPYLPKGG